MAKKKKKSQYQYSKSWDDCKTANQIHKMVSSEFANIIKREREESDSYNLLELHDLCEPYLSRRIEAVSNYIPMVRDAFGPKCPSVQVESYFASKCADPLFTFEEAEQDDSICLGATIWILDAIRDAGKTPELLSIISDDSYENASMLLGCPNLSDFCFSNDIIARTNFILWKRYVASVKTAHRDKFNSRDYRCLMCPPSSRPDTKYAQAFRDLLKLIPEERKRSAVRNFRNKSQEWMEISFSAMEEWYQEQDAAYKSLFAFTKVAFNADEEALTSAALSDPEHCMESMMQLLFQGMQKKLTVNELNKMEEICNSPPKYDTDQLDSYRENIHKYSIISPRISDDSMKDLFGEEFAERFSAFKVDDPYEVCFSLLYLVEVDDDLPWLYYYPLAVVEAAAAKLPWAYYYCSSEQNRNPLKAIQERNEWYDLTLSFYDNNPGNPELPYRSSIKRNLAQALYKKTGYIAPRNMQLSCDITTLSQNYGLSDDQSQYIQLALKLIDDLSHPITLPDYFDNDSESNLTSDGGSVVEDNHENELLQLKAEIERLRQVGHEVYREKKKLSDELDQVTAKFEELRQELADLREIVFNDGEGTSEIPPDDDHIVFPCQTNHKFVVFGGHDSWTREIKFKLPDVRFVGKDALPNEEMIRRADMVWIQPNALSHAMFYKIIDVVRRYNIPVRYFKYASATKCAEQLTLEDKERTF